MGGKLHRKVRRDVQLQLGLVCYDFKCLVFMKVPWWDGDDGPGPATSEGSESQRPNR